jgi:hypothetical protein
MFKIFRSYFYLIEKKPIRFIVTAFSENDQPAVSVNRDVGHLDVIPVVLPGVAATRNSGRHFGFRLLLASRR